MIIDVSNEARGGVEVYVAGGVHGGEIGGGVGEGFVAGGVGADCEARGRCSGRGGGSHGAVVEGGAGGEEGERQSADAGSGEGEEGVGGGGFGHACGVVDGRVWREGALHGMVSTEGEINAREGRQYIRET